MDRRHSSLLTLALWLVSSAGAPAGENWPQWRGPNGNGTSDSTNLPTHWNKDEHIVWKTPLPSWSGGSPVVWGDRVFVVSPTAPAAKPDDQTEAKPEPPPPPPPPGPPPGDDDRGERRGQGRRGGGRFGPRRDPGGSDLQLFCIARSDGRVLWQQVFDHGNRTWNKQNATSPSPVTDGQRVWAVTGNGAVAAFDMDGRELWNRNLQDDYGRFGLNWGYASSPLLHDGKLIIEVIHGAHTDDPSYLVALDGATGEVVWRVERPTDAVRESPDAYTTPALLPTPSGPQIVVTGADYVTGHDPASGREIWRAGGLNPRQESDYRIIASPVVVGDMLFAPTRKVPLLALRPTGTGDVTEQALEWKWDRRGAPDVPTPVSDGKYFYMVDDRGLATCLDANTGAVVWGPERTALGTVSASPVLADGKLYITNENGETTVVAAGPEFQNLATNELDGTFTLASPAVAGKQLFIRTSTHLYCIGD